MNGLTITIIRIVEQGWWATASTWRAGKDLLEAKVPLDNIALHAIAGTLIFSFALHLWKGSRRWAVAWSLALGFALWNELVDITTERWPDIGEQWAEAAFDLAVTMALPTLLLAIALFRQRRSAICT